MEKRLPRREEPRDKFLHHGRSGLTLFLLASLLLLLLRLRPLLLHLRPLLLHLRPLLLHLRSLLLHLRSLLLHLRSLLLHLRSLLHLRALPALHSLWRLLTFNPLLLQ